jgi:hypothetical protein
MRGIGKWGEKTLFTQSYQRRSGYRNAKFTDGRRAGFSCTAPNVLPIEIGLHDGKKGPRCVKMRQKLRPNFSLRGIRKSKIPIS